MARFVLHEHGSIRHHELSEGPVRIGADLGCELTLLGDGIEQDHAVAERGRTGWHVRVADGAYDKGNTRTGSNASSPRPLPVLLWRRCNTREAAQPPPPVATTKR